LLQSFEAAVFPPGDAKPDWEILALLFAKLGYSKAYSSLDEIRAEIAELVPLYSGLDNDGRESWIKESSNLRLFSTGEGKPIHFSPVIATETGSLGKNYAFKAILGSRRYHLGSGTRTGHSARIKDFALKGEVEVSPEDFERLDLKEGDRVRISSIHGSILREVILKKDLSPGLIFIPLAFDNNDAVNLIDFAEMGQADSPGWKECDVRVEKAED
jgi:formate dehydrogenase alpha subunit